MERRGENGEFHDLWLQLAFLNRDCIDQETCICYIDSEARKTVERTGKGSERKRRRMCPMKKVSLLLLAALLMLLPFAAMAQTDLAALENANTTMAIMDATRAAR